VKSLLVLVTYDVNTESVSGKRRLRQIAKQCVNFGQRVQNSVFECLIEPAQFVEFRAKLEKIADPSVDSLRYYFLGDNWHRRIEHYGAKTSYDPEDILMI
jgi:CRISPR-associated protein Cas2